ncbi:MAG: alkaline phosphatase D family protein, partial [Betaproteobacteria bacterium]|nr:alkaline phosphatase D family protein [Betaproteobacteria bacterium]
MHWLSEGAEVLIAELESGSPPRFDVVVVGSGYGGSVAAARFAQGGLRVCVLERGREYLPGEFPGDVGVLPRHVRISRPKKRKIVGDADALFDLRAGDDVAVLVGNALGGTSQINANVVEEPCTDIFKSDKWPAAFRDRPDEVLKDGFSRAKAMLAAHPVPAGRTYRKLSELEKFRGVLKDAKIASDFKRPSLAVHFEDETNPQGVAQKACKHCGDCITGCNHWAKNTLTMNYLPEARRHGARLFTGATVLYVSQPQVDGDHWTVGFRQTSNLKDGALNVQYGLRARMVVLAAGALGSTEILMRSSDKDLVQLSTDRLGKRFSTNGDTIGFGYDQDSEVNAFGWGSDPAPDESQPVGPTITGMIDLRATKSGSPRIVIEDGAFPGALRQVAEELLTMAAFPHQLVSPALRADVRRRDIDPLAVDPAAMKRTQIYLAMGEDDSRGALYLPFRPRPRTDMPGEHAKPDARENAAKPRDRKDDWPAEGLLQVCWPKTRLGEEPRAGVAFMKRAADVLKHSSALGAIPLENPVWHPLPDKFSDILSGPKIEGLLFTVHPLGGCAMADSAERGVVNDVGQVFSGVTGSAVHEGLLVLDGSIVPAAVGINPLLTITALAERALLDPRVWAAVGRKPGAVAGHPPANVAAPPWVPPPYFRPGDGRVELRFEEKIRGPLSGQAYRFIRGERWWDAPSPATREETPEESRLRQREEAAGQEARAALQGREADFEIEATLCWQHDDLRALTQLATKTVPLTGTVRFFARKPDDNDRLSNVNGFDLRLVPESARGPFQVPFYEAAVVKGSLRLMERDRRAAATVPAVIRWLRARGKDEALNALIRGCSREGEGMGKWLGRLQDMIHVWGHAGRRRTLKYDIEFFGPDGGCYALKGTKCIHYAGTNPVQIPLEFAERRFDEVCIHSTEAHRIWPFLGRKRERKWDPDIADFNDNLWVSLGAMPVVLVQKNAVAHVAGGETTAKTPIASGLLKVDLVDLVRNRPPQIRRQPDAIHGWLGLGGAMLYLSRVLLQGHVFAFKGADYPEDMDRKNSEPPAAECGTTGAPPKPRTRRVTPIWPEEVPDCIRRVYPPEAGGKAKVRLTRYRHRERLAHHQQPVLVFHGFAHSSAIFATSRLAPEPSNPGCENLVHHLCDHGFDVWLVDYRTSIAMDSCKDRWDYDYVSRYDVLAAFQKVADECRRERGLGADDVLALDVVAHCMGAAIVHMALLNDVLKTRDGWRIRRAVFSQVGPFVRGSDSNQLRAEFVALLRDLLDVDYIDLSANRPKDEDWLIGIADRIASTYPISKQERAHHRSLSGRVEWTAPTGPRGVSTPAVSHAELGDECIPRFDLATCLRTALALGENWNHENLTRRMHEALGELLGPANMRTFEQIQDFVQKKRLVAKEGINVYFTEEKIRQHYQFPMKFIHGKDNAVFDHATSGDSCVRIQRALGKEYPVLYSRIDGYGHLDNWLGKHAYRDVFPEISQFLLGAHDPDLSAHTVSRRRRFFKPCALGPILGWTRNVDGTYFVRVWWEPDMSRVEDQVAGTIMLFEKTGEFTPPQRRVFQCDIRSVTVDSVLLGKYCIADIPACHFRSGNRIAFGSTVLLSDVQRPVGQLPGGQPERNRVLLPSEIGPLGTWLKADSICRAGPHADYELPIHDPEDRLAEASLSDFDTLQRHFANADRTRLFVGSCRYAGTSFERDLSTRSFESMTASQAQPDMLVLLGDTIYADATGGVADTMSSRQRVVKRWVDVLGLEALSAMIKRTPVVMGIDDHELWEDFEPTHLGAVRSESEDILGDVKWARRAFHVYAASHSGFGPEPPQDLLPGQPVDNSAGFSHRFVLRGFCCFQLDTRTTRQSRPAGSDPRQHRIVSDAQWHEFRKWLIEAQSETGDRPKFVLSGSVIAPFHRETSRYRDSSGRDMYHYTRRDDSWQGYQKSLEDLVDLIVEKGIQNVVFLCGDYHASMTTTLEFGSGDPAENHKARSLRAYCVVASGLY